MALKCLVHVFVHHPVKLLAGIAVLSIGLICIPLLSARLPNFADPMMGFETRGTEIAQKIITWRNFYEAIQPSGLLTNDPKEYLMHREQTAKIKDPNLRVKNNKLPVDSVKRKGKNNTRHKKVPSPDMHGKIVTEVGNTTDYSRERWVKLHNLLGNGSYDKYLRMEHDDFFCGRPNDNYVQFVLKSDDEADLFNLDSLFKICRIESELMQVEFYTKLCLRNDTNYAPCCRPWSLPNYVALLNQRPNCLALTEKDVNVTLSLLRTCAVHYHANLLGPTCLNTSLCIEVPYQCRSYDAVYTIFHYLTNIEFLANGSTNLKLDETMIFLPVARSVATLPFYSAIQHTQMKYEGVSVVAMEFGAKNVLFDELLIRDTRYMILSACFVFICMWSYTGSVVLTLSTTIGIAFSLGLSYFVYIDLWRMEFFPFMNVLAGIVIIGIGADDAFIFCKVWHTMKANDNTLYETMTSTFYHALVSIFVTSITTAIAFLASYLSSITVIRCFGIFAGTAVIMNYLLMTIWVPPSIILLEKYSYLKCETISQLRNKLFSKMVFCHFVKNFNVAERLQQLQTFIVRNVIRLKYIFAIVFTLITVLSSIVVFYYPKLQIQRTNELQLFDAYHLFEQYDLVYKYKFAFTRTSTMDDPISMKYPLRFLWGVMPLDNGNYLNPKSTGQLTFDPTFNVSSPEAQNFVQRFCRSLQRQAFYHVAPGAFLTNCFIDTFVAWMHRPCIDPIDSDINRFPCCNQTIFPYDADVFNRCIIDAQHDLSRTPRQYLHPHTAGLQFSKEDPPEIRALVIEYESNYTYQAPYDEVNAFNKKVTDWLNAQLENAPSGLENGFFVSDLEYFDLQNELPKSTVHASLLAMALALVVLLCTTLSVTSVYAVFTITCSVLTIMGILVLLGWKVDILESIAISSTIGFTIDYCLHYAVNYKFSGYETREAAARKALAQMLGPTAMAAVTTGAAGAFMMLSDILAYRQLGEFLIVVTSVSWLFATCLLGSLLAIFGPEKDGKSVFSTIRQRVRQFRENRRKRPRMPAKDTSEAESLAVRYNNIETRKNSDDPCDVGAPLTQSPSTSAITFITTEDVDI